MMENGKRRKRRQLSPEEKWELFLEGTSQELSQADAARKWNVDVSVIIRLRALAKDAALAAFASAKPGRPASMEAVEVGVVARGERSAVGGVEGARGRVDVAPGKAALGLFGPVGARVSAGAKLELLGLTDKAVDDGWAHARACRVLDLADVPLIAGGSGCGRPARSRTAIPVAARSTASWRGRSRRSSI
jgi:transposase-like protein